MKASLPSKTHGDFRHREPTFPLDPFSLELGQRLQYRPLEEGHILRQEQKPQPDHPESEDREEYNIAIGMRTHRDDGLLSQRRNPPALSGSPSAI
jgi:hypothetical protein